MLAAVMVVGAAAGGAQRWVDIGPVQVQPSEFAKLGMVIVLAGYSAEKPVGEHAVFLKALGILAVPALLVLSSRTSAPRCYSGRSSLCCRI
jgi:rod shape determining protein RodA